MAVAVGSVALIGTLSLAFAARHNPAALAAPATPAAPSPAPATDRGQAVFDAQNCATCHAIAGQGYPRYPLDGVGATWTPAELRQWITGTGPAADVLPAAIAKRKQRYADLPSADMDALVAYLSTLQSKK